ncbi:4-hydroxy-tetrahydrodipicolinate synthase [Olivibacter sp. SDN3]|uniref:4-hydroxy-tetrahydrodipicolinate synthase n=1 Tax=Olivibacter sp. SDN3 TaxID=2764720 RepID=UPI001650E945|nr:4-hydroxy-tetrahydrodipicolinate synthase [Olivibacter sp. SDN3]QNL50111.1 4-hydroxy-tetrahydrodipicolinate synthase [Olivibacter sp. SDN3]
MNNLLGAGVALITPFNNDGSIDFDGLANLIEYQITGGMDYLVSMGTTGEVATLTKEEKKKILDFTAEQVNGRVPLVAGFGGNNTAELLDQIKSFDNPAYQAILSVSPYYNKPTQEGIYQHYKAVAQATTLPIILYNVPGRTGSMISVETIIRLATNFKNIIGVKEASANFEHFTRIMAKKPEGFLLISGDDALTLPMMSLGAVGVITVVGNAFPKQTQKLVKYCNEWHYEEARKLHYELLNIDDLCFIEGNPAGVKEMLKELGICGNHVRLPLVPVSEETKQKIAIAVKDLTAQN